jgi:hypothetical protein
MKQWLSARPCAGEHLDRVEQLRRRLHLRLKGLVIL